MGLLSLHLTEVAVRPGQRVVALVCMIGAIIVGRLAKSDPVLLVLIAGSPIFTALTFGRSLMLAEGKVTLRSAMVWILGLALPLIAAYVVAFAASVDTSSEKVLLGRTRAGASADTERTARLRVHLWNEAMRRIPGLGPGPHLEIPTGIAVGRWGESSPDLFHPQLNNTPNFEAYNTILGLIATAIPGWLSASAVLAIHRVQAGPSDHTALWARPVQHFPPHCAPSNRLVCDHSLSDCGNQRPPRIPNSGRECDRVPVAAANQDG